MIISGSDRAITDIIKASTVPSAAPLPSNAGSVGIHGNADQYRQGDGPPSRLSHESGHHAVGDIAVYAGSNRNAQHDIEPYPANDVAKDLNTVSNPLTPVFWTIYWFPVLPYSDI